MIQPLLEGALVRLTALGGADALILSRWQQDSQYLRLLDAQPAFPKNDMQMADWIRDGQRGQDRFLFGIRLVDTGDLIGFIELGEILWTHRASWIAIGIGEREHRGHGCGTEAMSLALDFAFRELNLHRVQLTVFGYNDRAIRLYERLGFQREGVYREFLERDGQRYDMLLYGLLRREWEGS
jgi:RimJ/RimL family protein N-acetyltransferase